jgi:BirA family biotin operon repressor/biotin-[acetyl-CoA-carboxylase] ligase
MAGPDTPIPLTFTLLRLLADGEFHSGEAMARDLQISRSSIHNALQDIEAYGLTLYRVRGRGYRLVDPPQWLSTTEIGNYLGKQWSKFHIQVIDAAPSSNTLLLQQASQGAPSGSVLAVEWQSGGRGRLGRSWCSALGNALTFSLLWRFERDLASLSGLSLAIGVALLRALHLFGIEGLQLKWPNDILGADGAKLAGILIEAQGDMLGPASVVIGIGLNLYLPQQVARQIDLPATCLANLTAKVPDRNHLLAVLLCELDKILRDFSANGFIPIRAEWESHHAHQNRPVRLLLPNGQISGVACGITNDGALKLETGQGMRIFHSGEISLRDDA